MKKFGAFVASLVRVVGGLVAALLVIIGVVGALKSLRDRLKRR